MVSNEEIKRMLDAKRRGVDIKREKIKSDNSKVCPNCKTKNPEKALFCVKCGNKLEKKLKVKCQSCGIENPSDAKFCVNCGETLNKVNLENKTPKLVTNKSESNDVEFSKPDIGNDESKDKTSGIKSGESKRPVSITNIPPEVPEHNIINKPILKKTCPSCNGQNLKNAKFCVICGEKFDELPSNNLKEEENAGKTSVIDRLHRNEQETTDDVSDLPNETTTPETNVPDSTAEMKNTKKPELPLVDEKTTDKTDLDESNIQESKITEDSIDPVEKIKKAKELLDIGAITSEEFDHIKKKYIEQI